jgi:hypoxanthine phosphoribosyltransferase
LQSSSKQIIRQKSSSRKISVNKLTPAQTKREKRSVILGDLTFHLITPYSEIKAECERIGQQINKDYADKENPIFLGVLNGAFMFMAELLHNINFVCKISFIKIASYSETSSARNDVKELIRLSNNLAGLHVIIIEDIADSGKSIDYLMKALAKYEPTTVNIVCLMFKPEEYKMNYEIKYHAFTISNLFVV